MLSSVIRFGIALGSAAMLASCGGSTGQALTQQSTPEGLFSGTNQVYVATGTNPDGSTMYSLETQNWLVFIESTGAYYAFYSQPYNPASGASQVLGGVQQGTMGFGGGGISGGLGGLAATGLLDINLQTKTVTNPNFSGSFTTGQNIAGTLNYPTIEYTGGTASPSCQNIAGTTTTTTTSANGAYSVCFNLPYNADYQKVQSLSTLAGTYTGTVATSAGSKSATFTFGPASVPANAGNQFGVGIVSGTDANGCTYTGTVSPLFKGNGYNLLLNSGNAPCVLPNNSFNGLVYLNTTTNQLYSLAPDAAHGDAVIFTGTRN